LLKKKKTKQNKKTTWEQQPHSKQMKYTAALFSKCPALHENLEQQHAFHETQKQKIK